MPDKLLLDKDSFLEKRKEDMLHAAQMVALQLSCGIDLQRAIKAPSEQKITILRKLKRLIRRERLKGLNQHWSYDLNRHIALKQVHNRLLSLIAR